MADNRTHSKDPGFASLPVVATVAARPGVCGECAHPAGRPRGRTLRVLLLGHQPLPASCRIADGYDDPSGWPTECGCVSAFHGS